MGHNITGKKLKCGVGKEFDDVELQSADFSEVHETKEWRDHNGDTMTVDEYDHAVEVSASGLMLADADTEAFKKAFGQWVKEVATASPFNLDDGGTVFFTEFKVSEQNEDAATVSIGAKYRPNVKAQNS